MCGNSGRREALITFFFNRKRLVIIYMPAVEAGPSG